MQRNLLTIGAIFSYKAHKDAKETVRCKWMLVETELFNIVVSDFDAKKSTRYRRVPVLTELVASETHFSTFY